MRNIKELGINVSEEELISPGHMACPGCGAGVALRVILKMLGPNTVAVSCPSCASGIAQNFLIPSSHAPFASVGSWSSGVRAGLDMQGKKDTTVLAIAGDGGTFDIGIQALSAASERNENIFFLCYDNEAYMTTGIQRSSATPQGAWTTTTPLPGAKSHPKKNIVEIMAAHRVPYAATASIGYPEDFMRKVQRAKDTQGMRFMHVFTPCPTGWRFDPDHTVKLGRLAVETRVFPLYEVEDGLRYTIQPPRRVLPVSEYMKGQGRFAHLKEADIAVIQENVDREWELLARKAMHSQEMACVK